MEKIFAIMGMAICLFVTYLFSKEKKNIQWKSVLIAFFGQILLHNCTYQMYYSPICYSNS